MEFEALRRERKEIGDLARLHAASLRLFRNPKRAWFRLTPDEEFTRSKLAHLSSTATCIESLADLPMGEDGDRAEVALAFAKAALRAQDDRWQSEGAAQVYCRVRTLPAILRLAPLDLLQENIATIRRHLEFVWRRVSTKEGNQGVSEAAQEAGEGQDYPPHSFHTYWAIRCLEECKARGLIDALPDRWEEKANVADLWTDETLGNETALILSHSERADGNQLAWALTTQLMLHPLHLITRESARRDQYKAALEAFFGEQLESGSWPLYQPLFHYPKAGNAYCYTFETLTELLRQAVHPEQGRPLRELLRPHYANLVRAWRFALETNQPLRDGGAGWSSGHHPYRVDPEAWATAMVYSFLQCFRRLVARSTRDAAAQSLGVRPSRWAIAEQAISVLAHRGRTWTSQEKMSAGERLSAMFLHPAAAGAMVSDLTDPDTPVVASNQARSAILFGPPGTSKTTLVEALAGALGWDFLEVLASDFLSGGIDRIPERADDIFLNLMELDHCVVLFDEIDELLRERQDSESDPFSRFLTTSMLPKVARLWEQRRILFFVATNDIKHADGAIKRSQRFDATIFVAPPSYESKMDELGRLLGRKPMGFSLTRVHQALERTTLANPWGVLALLRHDQVSHLAERMKSEAAGGDPTRSNSRDALRSMGDELKDSEWQSADDKDPYELFREFWNEERRDRRMLQLIAIDEVPAQLPKGTEAFDSFGGPFLLISNEPLFLMDAVRHKGRLVIKSGGKTLTDSRLLTFVTESGS